VFSSPLETSQPETNYKKRKILATGTPKFLDYLSLKLPALMFFHYLETDAPLFIKDCLRTAAFSRPVAPKRSTKNRMHVKIKLPHRMKRNKKTPSSRCQTLQI